MRNPRILTIRFRKFGHVPSLVRKKFKKYPQLNVSFGYFANPSSASFFVRSLVF